MDFAREIRDMAKELGWTVTEDEYSITIYSPKKSASVNKADSANEVLCQILFFLTCLKKAHLESEVNRTTELEKRVKRLEERIGNWQL